MASCGCLLPRSPLHHELSHVEGKKTAQHTIYIVQYICIYIYIHWHECTDGSWDCRERADWLGACRFLFHADILASARNVPISFPTSTTETTLLFLSRMATGPSSRLTSDIAHVSIKQTRCNERILAGCHASSALSSATMRPAVSSSYHV